MHDRERKVVVVMTAMVGRPEWFGLSLPRMNGSMLGQWWWCAITLLAVIYRDHGIRAVWWCVRHAIDPRYVYDGRHYLATTEDEPVTAVALILEMRREREERQRTLVPVLQVIHATQYITPLEERSTYVDWIPMSLERIAA
jgi:hypothetical protein